MLGFLLRIFFLTVMARLAARLLGVLTGRPARRDPAAPQPHRRSRLAGDIVDAEFEDLGDGRR